MNAKRRKIKNCTALKTQTIFKIESRDLRCMHGRSHFDLWDEWNHVVKKLKQIRENCLVHLERSIMKVSNKLYWRTSGWLIGEDEGDTLPSFWIVKASRESFTRTFWSSARLICIEIQPVFRKLCKKNKNHKFRVYLALSLMNNSLWLKNN